jgi:hypothetical protein
MQTGRDHAKGMGLSTPRRGLEGGCLKPPQHNACVHGPMNDGVQADKFHMENVEVVLRLLRRGYLMLSLDLRKRLFPGAY